MKPITIITTATGRENPNPLRFILFYFSFLRRRNNRVSGEWFFFNCFSSRLFVVGVCPKLSMSLEMCRVFNSKRSHLTKTTIYSYILSYFTILFLLNSQRSLLLTFLVWDVYVSNMNLTGKFTKLSFQYFFKKLYFL